MSDKSTSDDAKTPGTTRRKALALGAVTATAVVSIRPALAQSVGSVLKCDIPVPAPNRAGSWIAADGSLVPAGTKGAIQGGRTFGGEEVKRALNGNGMLPGTGYDESQAYMNYIRRLQSGTSGFTCFASLQMPRR